MTFPPLCNRSVSILITQRNSDIYKRSISVRARASSASLSIKIRVASITRSPHRSCRRGQSHQKSNLSSNFKLIWVVQSLAKKYSAFSQTQITTISIPVPAHMRGVSRSSRTLGRDAVDAAASGVRWDRRAGLITCERSPARGRTALCGRRSRVVLAPVAGVKSAEVLRAQPGSTMP
jgi:hypothetical protein